MSLDPSIASGAVLLTRAGRPLHEGGVEEAIWRLIDSPRTFPEVVQALRTTAGVRADDVARQAGDAVGSLIARGVIEPIADADD
jgi:hypothetical protein